MVLLPEISYKNYNKSVEKTPLQSVFLTNVKTQIMQTKPRFVNHNITVSDYTIWPTGVSKIKKKGLSAA